MSSTVVSAAARMVVVLLTGSGCESTAWPKTSQGPYVHTSSSTPAVRLRNFTLPLKRMHRYLYSSPLATMQSCSSKSLNCSTFVISSCVSGSMRRKRGTLCSRSSTKCVSPRLRASNRFPRIARHLIEGSFPCEKVKPRVLVRLFAALVCGDLGSDNSCGRKAAPAPKDSSRLFPRRASSPTPPGWPSSSGGRPLYRRSSAAFSCALRSRASGGRNACTSRTARSTCVTARSHRALAGSVIFRWVESLGFDLFGPSPAGGVGETADAFPEPVCSSLGSAWVPSSLF
mmetsp:Transcript_1580/g.2061  ORF Transcript_1580/g.2061 Transcript_1580/m.2061 type:complete len:286 (+) Transcript_1580:153-1010(+)